MLSVFVCFLVCLDEWHPSHAVAADQYPFWLDMRGLEISRETVGLRPYSRNGFSSGMKRSRGQCWCWIDCVLRGGWRQRITEGGWRQQITEGRWRQWITEGRWRQRITEGKSSDNPSEQLQSSSYTSTFPHLCQSPRCPEVSHSIHLAGGVLWC